MRDIGLPPKHWMNLERMVVARRKLEGGKSVEEVAEDLGFLSVESFRRRFYNVYRISPGRFQKRRLLFDPSNPIPPAKVPGLGGGKATKAEDGENEGSSGESA